MSRRLLASARSRGRQEFALLQRAERRQFTTSEWHLAEADGDDRNNSSYGSGGYNSNYNNVNNNNSSSSPSSRPTGYSAPITTLPTQMAHLRSQSAARDIGNMAARRLSPDDGTTRAPSPSLSGSSSNNNSSNGLSSDPQNLASLAMNTLLARGGRRMLGLKLPPRNAPNGVQSPLRQIPSLGQLPVRRPRTGSEGQQISSNGGRGGSVSSNFDQFQPRARNWGGGGHNFSGPGMMHTRGQGLGSNNRGRGRGRGRGGGMRGGGGDEGSARGRRDGNGDGDEEDGVISRWRALENEMSEFEKPRTQEEYEYVERRERGLAEPFNPSLTLESLLEHAPALAVDSNPWGRYGTALLNLRLLGGSRPYEVEGSFAPAEMGRLLRRENTVFLTDPAMREEYAAYVEGRRDEAAEHKNEDRREMAPYVVPAAEDSVREAIAKGTIRGEYEAPCWAPIEKPAAVVRNLALKSETYTEVDVDKLQEKVNELLSKAVPVRRRLQARPAA